MLNREQRDRERDGYYSDRNELIRERERERERDRGYLSDHNSRWVFLSLSIFHSLLHLFIHILCVVRQLLNVSMRFMYWRIGTRSMVPSLGRLAVGQFDIWLGFRSRPNHIEQ